MPRKMSVFPNVVGHWVITSGLGPVTARKASTAAHGVALRESVQTVKSREPADSAHRRNVVAQKLNPCQDFLTLWKDADPDIPILKQAKAEYARQ